METIINVVEEILFLVGLGTILHYFAFAISWGWQKGRAKVPTVYTINQGQK